MKSEEPYTIEEAREHARIEAMRAARIRSDQTLFNGHEAHESIAVEHDRLAATLRAYVEQIDEIEKLRKELARYEQMEAGHA